MIVDYLGQPKGKNGQLGYTLIELLLVLVILAGAGFVLLIKLPLAMDSQRLNLASTQLVEELREVKQAALTENVWYQVKFYSSNTYTINRQGQRLKEIKLPNGVQYAYLPQDIIFGADGIPTVGGTILLEINELKKKVIIAPVGGRIREE